MNYIALGQNAWGAGKSAEEAIRNMVKAGGSRRRMFLRCSLGEMNVDPVDGGLYSTLPTSPVAGYPDPKKKLDA